MNEWISNTHLGQYNIELKHFWLKDTWHLAHLSYTRSQNNQSAGIYIRRKETSS